MYLPYLLEALRPRCRLPLAFAFVLAVEGVNMRVREAKHVFVLGSNQH